MVCEKVFLGRPYFGVGNDVDLVLKENGLLVSKHGHRKLKELLKTCSNPSKSKDSIRLATPNKIKVELYKALEQIVNFMEDAEDQWVKILIPYIFIQKLFCHDWNIQNKIRNKKWNKVNSINSV